MSNNYWFIEYRNNSKVESLQLTNTNSTRGSSIYSLYFVCSDDDIMLRWISCTQAAATVKFWTLCSIRTMLKFVLVDSIYSSHLQQNVSCYFVVFMRQYLHTTVLSNIFHRCILRVGWNLPFLSYRFCGPCIHHVLMLHFHPASTQLNPLLEGVANW